MGSKLLKCCVSRKEESEIEFANSSRKKEIKDRNNLITAPNPSLNYSYSNFNGTVNKLDSRVQSKFSTNNTFGRKFYTESSENERLQYNGINKSSLYCKTYNETQYYSNDKHKINREINNFFRIKTRPPKAL